MVLLDFRGHILPSSVFFIGAMKIEISNLKDKPFSILQVKNQDGGEHISGVQLEDLIGMIKTAERSRISSIEKLLNLLLPLYSFWNAPLCIYI